MVRCLFWCLVLVGWSGLSADVIQLHRPQPSANPADSSRASLTAAQAAFQDGRLDECRSLLKTAVQDSDRLAHADVILCEWLWRSGQQRQATTVMEALAKEHPNRVDVRLMFANAAVQQGRLFDAWTHAHLADSTQVSDRWSQETVAEFRNQRQRLQAVIAARRGDWDTAQELAVGLHESTGKAKDLLLLAEASFALGDHRSAAQHVRDACEDENVDAVPELVLVQFAREHADDSVCEQCFHAALRLTGDDAVGARLKYARWLLQQNRPDDLLPVLKGARHHDDSSVDADYLLALANRMNGNFTAAESTLARLHQADPANFGISNQLALVLIESTEEGKRARAMQIAAANARRFGNNLEARSTLGWIHHRLGDPVAAEKALTLSLQGGVASRDTAFYLAQVKQALGKEDESQALLNAALKGQGEFFRLKDLETDSDRNMAPATEGDQ